MRLCKNFAINCVKNARTKKHFKFTEKTHAMKTREQRVYNVAFANTERFRRSTIPYLQRLLNKDSM